MTVMLGISYRKKEQVLLSAVPFSGSVRLLYF
jgi:hypothetical protein